MRVEELTEQWLADIERIICLTGSEFAPLNEKQFNYSVHIHRCNTRQILLHLLKCITPLILALEHALRETDTPGRLQGFHAGWIGKYAHRRAEHIRCIRKKQGIKGYESREPGHRIIEELIKQQNKLKELILLCNKADLNKRVIPFLFFGVIKLSIGETMEYLILCQKNHFRLTRRILMLQ